jgi:hypothetical protein
MWTVQGLLDIDHKYFDLKGAIMWTLVRTFHLKKTSQIKI